VLQEVAAARHVVIISRTAEMDGYAFCLGWNALKLPPKEPGTESRIRSTAYLIKGAVLRPKYLTNRSDRFSLQIRSLGELMDMYHDRKASDLRDKVYALLGMSSDLPFGKTPDFPDGITPDYDISWEKLFSHLVKSLVGEQATVTTGDEKDGEEEIVIIKNKACVLGEVSKHTRDDRWDITWKSHLDTKGKQSSLVIPSTSAKPVEVGDLVCFLQGASKPTIVRPCNGYSTIIMIALSPSDDSQPRVTTFPHDILLVWDWRVSQTQSPDGDRYEGLISSQYGPECARTGRNCQDLDKAIRLWNFGLLLDAAERYKEAGKNLREAVSLYGKAMGNTHGPWRQADEEALRVMHFLLIEDKGAAIEAECKNGRTPLLWAAANGYEAVIQQLLEKGSATETTDKNGRTSLSWAAGNGHAAVVQRLLEKGAAIEVMDKLYGRTSLSWAAENGHEEVVRLLVDKGANIEAEDRSYRTPLSWAAENGHEGVVRLLFDKGANINAADENSQTPLLWAADNGHEGVVRLLKPHVGGY